MHSAEIHHPFLSEEIEKSAKKLRILLVSDIHQSFENIEKLRTWFQTSEQYFDIVFAPGDFLTLPNLSSDPELTDPIAIGRSEGEISTILSLIESFGSKLYYLGGNHDPSSIVPKEFNPDLTLPSLNPNSLNAHYKIFHINEQIALLGMGGSVPASCRPTVDEPEKSVEKHWLGFPYRDDEEFGENLNAFIRHHEEELEGKQVILLTHCGPYESGTTIDCSMEDKMIFSGSKALGKLIKSKKINILTNIHGHTHEAQGKSQLLGVPIINPGRLETGAFGVVELSRVISTWRVDSVQFNSL